MPSHAIQDRYHDAASVVHSLDPRLKLLATLAFIGAVSLVSPHDWPAYVALLVIALAVTAAARVPVHSVLRHSTVALPFAAIVALSLPFVQGGVILWSGRALGLRLVITDEGLWRLGGVLAKAWLSVLIVSLLMMTTPMPHILDTLRRLKLPVVLVMTIALLYRYLFVLVDEAGRLETAREARSAGAGGSLRWRARVLGGIIGSLFIRSYGRSERVYAAMLARGYDGTSCALDEPLWRRRDWWAAATWLAALAGALAIGQWGII